MSDILKKLIEGKRNDMEAAEQMKIDQLSNDLNFGKYAYTPANVYSDVTKETEAITGKESDSYYLRGDDIPDLDKWKNTPSVVDQERKLYKYLYDQLAKKERK